MEMFIGGIGLSIIAAGYLKTFLNKPEKSLSVDEWRPVYEREKIIKYLPYEDYIEKDELYITNDGGVGLVIECSPFPLVSSKTFDAIMSALDVLPEKAAIQFSLVSGADVFNMLEYWKNSKTRKGNLEQDIVSSYYDFIAGQLYNPISLNFSAPVRNIRLVISIKLGGKEKKHGLFSLSSSKAEYERFKESYQQMRSLKDRMISILKSGQFSPRIADPDNLIRLIFSIFNQNHDIRYPPKWDGSMITNFMVANDSTVEIHDDFIKCDGVYGKSMAVKSYPEQWSMAEVLDYTGSIFRDDNFSAPFIITLNASKYPESEKTKIKTRASVVMGQNMPYALFPRLKHKHIDLGVAMEKLEKGEDLYYCSMGTYIFGKSEEQLKEATGQMQTFYRGLGFRLEEDKYINFPSLISMLPLGFDMEMQDFLGFERGRALFGDNVASLAPISADWKGNMPEMLLVSPRGQLQGFDLFSNDAGGFNSFVVGTTGSGKSVALQTLALSYYLSNNKIWIIDIGRSYERFTHIFGGQFIELKRDNPMSLNPFTHIESKEDLDEFLDFLIDLYLLLGLPREKTLSEQLERLMKSYLEDAIKECYEEYGVESDVDRVIEFLEKDHGDDQRIIDFIKTLSPYRKSGQYGGFLNGRSTVNFHSDIVTMENDTLENIPDLRDPALMLLTFHISREIYLMSKTHPGMKHIVIIDEAHKFLGKSPHIDLFIEQAYRRFRKHGAAMILGTQGFEDFYGGETISRAGRVIVENSFWKFFMMQSATSRAKLKKSGYIPLSPYEEQMMDSVNPVAGEYGETIVISEHITAKARFLLSPFLKTLMFSNSALRERMNHLVHSEGLSWMEALQKIDKEGL